ncbi:MAG: tetratricopeptide repeat protein [Xenococcaceae cyanobacterium MO_207.B15]|nr:tetratricopeptide repeat protein [Xenococcaceae cyanobacterium MO_207.B15]
MSNYWDRYEKRIQIGELDRLGSDYWSEFQYAKAEKFYQKAAELAESIQDFSLIIKERYSLAEMQRMQGKNTEALDTYIWLIGIANDPAQSSQLIENDLWYVAQGFDRLLETGRFLPDLQAVNLEEVIVQGLNWLDRIGKLDWSSALRLQRALLWKSQGRNEDALAEMEAALAQKRRNPSIPGLTLGFYLTSFADFLKNVGKLAESKQYYQEVTNGDRFSDYDMWLAWGGLANTALQEGDLGKAEICADKSLELAQIIESLEPLTLTYELLTRIYYQQGTVERNITAAIQTWRYARQGSREDLLYKSYLNIAKIRIAQSKQKNPQYYIRKAKQWLERSHPLALRLDRQVGLTTNQDTIRSMRAECAAILAVNFKIEGNKEKAEQQHHQLLALNSDSASTTYYDLGYAYKQQGKLEEAIAYYQQAIEIDPQYADPHNGLGNVYKGQGKLDEAISGYEQAIQLDPQFVYPHYNLGLVYADQGKLEEAIAYYQQAIEIDPQYADPHNGLGFIYLSQGNLEEAISAYQQAIELDPKFAASHNNLGLVYEQQGKLEEAISAYQQALQLDPKFAASHYSLGNVYEEQGKLEEAITSYRRAIKLDAQDTYSYYNLGIIYYSQGKLEAALAEFNHIIETNLNEDWNLYTKAVAYLVMNQQEKAQDSLVNAIQIAQGKYEKNQKNWPNTFNLALYHLAAGEEERAEILYREAQLADEPKELIQIAIKDLNQFLILFPKHTKAKSIKELLKAGRNN